MSGAVSARDDARGAKSRAGAVPEAGAEPGAGAAPDAGAAPGAASEHADVHLALPTVREVLRLDAVVEGVPEVLSGADALDGRVRWVHVSDSAGVARLLNGGELLLSTGSGWPQDPDALRAFIAGLIEVGIAGLVLELGTHYRWVPAVIAEAAQEHGLVLVALHHEVKYVTITEVVHRLIIDRQTAALRARDEVRDRFTALTLRGSPADYVVQQLSVTLGAPVVLENLAHEVVAAEVPPAREEELFGDWERRSRAAHQAAGAHGVTESGWLVVPVEARGTRWGHLLALPGPEHPAGRLGVLQQGAIALALGRLADGPVDEWERQARRRLVDRLLAGRFASVAGAVARLDAAGLPVQGRRLFGLVISRAEVTAAKADAAARAISGRAIVGAAPAGAGGLAATLLLSLPAEAMFSDDAAIAFATAAAGEGAVVSVGSPAAGLDQALRSLQEAIDLSRGGLRGDRRSAQLRRADTRPLVRLVTNLREDHRLLEHGERMLAPLVEYDLARGGDLLDVLGAVLSHPANRTAAAAASHLSRSVFYQRIALIEELLDLDLDDGETQTALHLALLVRRSGAARR
ncbi:PucR family transcriptional regulator [Microbacterium sp. YJN-G]|uniref:PucR family transcriptional regulator n=1 Tax=Microbacterium sp. YJN-G TaxID=2763257 RepID=UPI001D0C7AB2|nr:PucR family transcriptional regulator ligand-binding domain-containing protein [Microbacterium sp. YJN-G]